MPKTPLSHLNRGGQARMVDVTGKAPSSRVARARAVVTLGRALADQVRRTGQVAKGNVLETARLAGVMAAKDTARLIPLCHPLPLDVLEIQVDLRAKDVVIEATAKTRAATGVEMEAMTAVTVAALTVYDMCKAASKGIEIGPIHLLEKTGGKSGPWRRKRVARGR